MNNVKEKNHGKIVQVMGPVVDVEFENNDLPFIKDALEVYSEGKRLVMEVAQHIGNKNLYITSGHYAKYGKDSFQPIHTPEEGLERDNEAASYWEQF